MTLLVPSKGFMKASLAIVADAPAKAEINRISSRDKTCSRYKKTYRLPSIDSQPHYRQLVLSQLQEFRNGQHEQGQHPR